MDKIQIKFMRLNIAHNLLINQNRRGMREIFNRSVKAISALEREIIWIKLQEGSQNPPSYLVEVDKQLKLIRDFCDKINS